MRTLCVIILKGLTIWPICSETQVSEIIHHPLIKAGNLLIDPDHISEHDSDGNSRNEQDSRNDGDSDDDEYDSDSETDSESGNSDNEFDDIDYSTEEEYSDIE